MAGEAPEMGFATKKSPARFDLMRFFPPRRYRD
jgi:hypothetical protein